MILKMAFLRPARKACIFPKVRSWWESIWKPNPAKTKSWCYECSQYFSIRSIRNSKKLFVNSIDNNLSRKVFIRKFSCVEYFSKKNICLLCFLFLESKFKGRGSGGAKVNKTSYEKWTLGGQEILKFCHKRVQEEIHNDTCVCIWTFSRLYKKFFVKSF